MEIIVGVDEVGRGPAAGPVTVAAVILPPHVHIDGLTDSKLMNENTRLRVAREVRKHANAIGIGWANNRYIDEHGLTAALTLAGNRALAEINQRYDVIILDGIHDYLMSSVHTQCMTKAELAVPSVAAASVVAKVARDQYMKIVHKKYPAYGFDAHKGYLSAAHRQAIQDQGLSPVHRISWGNLRQYDYHGVGGAKS